MNQDYLWSKKGGDPEVERLDGLLSEFRFDGNSITELPTTNIAPVARGAKRPLILGLSFAATAAALVLITIWVRTEAIAPIAREQQSEESVPENAQTRNDDRVVYPMADRGKDVVSTAEPAYLSRPKAHDVRSNVNRTVPMAKAEMARLTKEEKYAYDRLMLALSITGSKLRVVQDTIDRKGDPGPQPIRNEK